MIYPLFAGILFRFQPFDGFHISGREAVNPVIVIIHKGVKEQMHETFDVHRLRQKLFYIRNFTPYGRYCTVREPGKRLSTSGSPFNAAFNVSRSVENNKVQ